MKDYIYKRICDAEMRIKDQIHTAQLSQAKDVNYKVMSEWVLRPMQIKTMPYKYRDQIQSILWFVYKWQVLDKWMWPVLFEGRLYSRWNYYPEELKELTRKSTTDEAMAMRPYPMWPKHFTEGMEEIK